MFLNKKSLEQRAGWQAAGISLPTFDMGKVAEATRTSPTWVHFGAGNIFRIFPAAIQQALLDMGAATTGIIVAEGYDYEIIDRLFLPHDCLSLGVTLKSDGSIAKQVIGSVTEALKLDSDNHTDFSRLREIFRAPTLQMASFTITEKGYCLTRADGELLPEVAVDFAAGAAAPKSYIGKLVALCLERYTSGALPLALVSMDNCSHNGDRLRDAVTAFAKAWESIGAAPTGFVSYLNNPDKISFPWSMIDKITPRPDDAVKAMLLDCGFQDVEGSVTAKNTFVAPFVNAEETQYLVIEDHFPAGHPPLENGGVIFTSRETVDKVEKMKVCTCLNPLHTALAIFGCLLGYTKISDEMRDPDLVHLVECIGYVEGLPVVVDPGILNPKEFLDSVLRVRLPNPFMPDTPQRIACDTSQKLSIRFGETIKAYAHTPELEVAQLKCIPLVLAGWCRYLLGVNDKGDRFELSPDPMLSILTPTLNSIAIGNTATASAVLSPILSNSQIFGVNLYAVGLGNEVERLFAELCVAKGAVRTVLHRHGKSTTV